MRNACSHCQGKFGLIRHRWLFHQFCRPVCKTEFLKAKALMRLAYRSRAERLRQSPPAPL